MTLPDRVASLNRRHQGLAARCVQGTVSPQDRQGFVDDLVAAGASVPPGADRDGLLAMLFFWAGEQTSRDERPRSAPVPRLAPFDPALASASAEPPERATALPETAARSAAPAGSEGGAEGRSAPKASPQDDAAAGPGPSVLTTSALPQPVTTIIAGASGVAGAFGDALKALRPEKAEPVDGVAAAGPASSAPPSDKEARAIVRIAALARQWRTTDAVNKPGYLLTGKALTEAAAYVDRDPEIRDLVAASRVQAQAADRKRRQMALAMLLVTGIALLGFVTAIIVSLLAARRENRELQQALAERAREREQIRDKARSAVDALAFGDVARLKTFLQRFGDAAPEELARLQVGSGATTSTSELTSSKSPQRNAKSAAPPQSADAGTCTGYLWLGGRDDSRLRDKRDPASLKAGETVSLEDRSDLRLRTDWPSDAYVMSAQNGQVPAGSDVTVTGAPRTYSRTTQQVWAPVSVPRAFCTSVFLQYVGTPAKRDAALAALRDLDVQTPPAEQIDGAKGLFEVRYFWPKDKAVADQVAAALGPFGSDGSVKVVALTDFPAKPSSGTIEAWLDLSR